MLTGYRCAVKARRTSFSDDSLRGVCDGMLSAGLMPAKRTIAAGWAVVAFAYTPAVWLVGATQGQSASLPETLCAMAVFFLPWALSTPTLLRLSAGLPLIPGRTARSLPLLGLAGIIVIPTITAVGLCLEVVLELALGSRAPSSIVQLATGVAITSFFSVPVYCAVVGVGQTLVWVERTRHRERMLARARLETLRAQINPHFLFNALGAVAELAHRDATAAQNAIARLADVLRTTLANDAEEATLAEEVALTKDHIELHRLLLPAELDVRMTMSDKAWTARVPALILQPLAENAFVHGLGRIAESGGLTITGNVDDGRLVIEIANAIADAKLSSRGLGSGLAGVRERLTAWNDGSGTMTVDRRADRFVVRIDMPYVDGRLAS
ncbi:sensor histidine kinase [Sphingomonas panni]|uniref:sensor histidine kinase n=1 Tax=Sphingomonas panni TaxID=237612 RepID=UPI001F5C0408|nr:histidine kinase [Sphingomonas panni]